MTLAEERAATRSGVASSRASTFKRDLNSLETARRQTQVLNTLERKGLRAATRGRGVWKEPAKTGAGGIASPLTEKTKVDGTAAVPDRDYYGTVVVATSDGIFTMEIKPIKTLRLADADGADVVVNLAEPAT